MIFSFPGIQEILEAIITVDAIIMQGALNTENHKKERKKERYHLKNDK